MKNDEVCHMQKKKTCRKHKGIQSKKGEYGQWFNVDHLYEFTCQQDKQKEMKYPQKHKINGQSHYPGPKTCTICKN